MSAPPDAVVVGAGHNGLVCATYLARSGMRVTVLEARAAVGGRDTTAGVLGAPVNVGGCDHLVFPTTPVMEELRLADHGLRFLQPDPCAVAVDWERGSTPFFLFADTERTLDGLAVTHPRSTGAYARYLRVAQPAAQLLLELANEVPTPGAVARRLLARGARGAATLLSLSRRSAASVLRTMFRDDDLVAPACVFGPVAGGQSPDAPGTGLAALTYALRHTAQVGRPEGGSGMVPVALCGALEAAGGTVRAGARVTAVLAEGSRVRGVRLAGGEEILASTVVVACDARRALVSWLDDPPPIAQDMVARWQSVRVRDGYESRIDAVVHGAPPRVVDDGTLLARLGVDDPAVATTVVHPGVDGLIRNHWELGPGRVAWRPALVLSVPSVLDPGLRAGGDDHLVRLQVLWTPYALDGGWEASAEPRRWLGFLDLLCQPGTLGRVREWRAHTPPDYERELGLVRGHTPTFSGGPLAALRARDPERSRYRTPVEGLYLTGSDTFPGAGIWGASGRNAAGVVLAARGARRSAA